MALLWNSAKWRIAKAKPRAQWRGKWVMETFPQNSCSHSICRRMNTAWALSLKKCTVGCLKNPLIPNILTHSCSAKDIARDNFVVRSRARSVWVGLIFICFHPFSVVSSDKIDHCIVLYHFARYMRIYRSISEPYINDFWFSNLHMKSTSSRNLCGSST